MRKPPTSEKPVLTNRFVQALGYAAELHLHQRRKGKGQPYVGHLLGVAAIVIQHGGGEDEVIAALLHDAVEDQGGLPRLNEIRKKFGPHVARIVDGCTDSYEASREKRDWGERKRAYIEKVAYEPEDVRLVSAADKLANAREILADLRVEGESVFSRFSGRKDGTLWYYRALVNVFRKAGSSPLVEELDRVVTDLESLVRTSHPSFQPPNTPAASNSSMSAILTASSSCVGARLIPSEDIDRAFGMPVGKLRNRAGIESIAQVAAGENEFTLAVKAAQQVLNGNSCPPQEIDWIISTSETHHDYPSLCALLHSQLLMPENCGALDVGGACLGLLNALSVAQSLISSGQARNILVVTADVHSRTLRPGRVAGEFGGLFGDGASAFLLRSPNSTRKNEGFALGEFIFGCAGQYAPAIQVSDAKDGNLDVRFDGEALSRAAITRMEKVLAAIELRSGIPRAQVGGFATHQPNPRLVALLAKQLRVSPDKFPAVARVSGNLGSSTCAAALHELLRKASAQPIPERRPIFLASLGPGLLFGGSWLTPYG